MAYSPLITHHIISNSTSETKNPTIQTCLHHCNIQKTFLKNNTTSPILGFCPMVCLPICPSLCHYTYSNDPLLIPSPPNFPSSKPNKPHNIISPLLITIITLFSLSFLFIIFYILYTKLYQTSHRISQRSESETDRNYSLDEEHGNRVVFHPFWNISTFGLALSAIQRIPIKKYVKENNMEERDCTVCLGEFKEGESLRVLPKCCHVFHVSCIDTWLASHITCPICRSHVLPLDHHDDHDHDHDHDHDCGV